MSDLADDVRVEAQERGVMVVESDSHHLQLDIDVPYDADWGAADDRWVILRRDTKLLEAGMLRTRSQNGRQHIYVRLTRGLKIQDRILLQLALGSDPTRELLSYLRIGKRSPALVLFETPDEYERVMNFLNPPDEEEPAA